MPKETPTKLTKYVLLSSVFRTCHHDPNINETSSYVDLGPLYGNSQKDQDRIRIRNGRGLLYPDVFAEDRLLLLPPAVCALLVLFSRNHNVCCSPDLFYHSRLMNCAIHSTSPPNFLK